ncbi:MAG: MFS transporter [Porticoccaceae bacterium]|nr:MFS transporter [Porticoccaceae bacterium]
MSRKAVESQFQLMKSRRFLPLFIALFLGAFNDNLFRNCLLVLMVTGMFASVGVDTNTLVNLAAALFVLPFFLFSPLAGQLADKYDKAMLVRRIKFAEILIIGCAGLALFLGSLWGVMAMLFITGAQSTFFGPIKYSILPQHLAPTELVGGNALVEMGTFVSILIGTLLGTLIGGMDQVLWVIVPFLMAVAVLGWLASCRVPPAEPHAPTLRIDWNPGREMIQLLKLAREKTAVWHAILGIAWFWLLGMAYLTQMPNFVVAVLGGDANLIALLLCSFTIGIGLGTLLCDRLSSHRVEMGLVPLGSLGLSVFGIDLYFAATQFPTGEGLALSAFLSEPQGLRIVFDLVMLGTFGGFYIVPLNAMIQARTAGDKRARVIACRNIFTSLFMVLAGVMGMVFLGLAGFAIPEFFLALALMNIAVALFIYRQVPEFTLRFLVWLLGHSMYRVRHVGLDQIPKKGGAVLVCNHVSYVDAMLIGGAVQRPVRFVMDKDIYHTPGLNYLFRAGGAIPICPRKEDEAAYQDAMAQIAARLEEGELLCIFPEGKLTRDGEIDDFRSGIEHIVARTPVPVVPMALRGLWGSFFSHRGGLFRRGWKLFARIDLVAGTPLPPEQATREGLRQQVVELRGEKK